MSCPACGHEAVRVAMRPDGMVRMCAMCAVALPAESPPEPVSTPKAQTPQSAPKTPTAGRREAKRTTASEVIRQAKTEAARLRRSIRAHERALATERKQLAALSRLLDAAADKRPAVVRQIRTTA